MGNTDILTDDTGRFFRTVLTPLSGIVAVNLVLAILFNMLAQSSNPLNVSYGSILVASIALMSLYLAWKKFYIKRSPNLSLTWDSEENEDGSRELKLKIFNQGSSPVYLKNMRYGYASYNPEKHKISMNNGEWMGFDKDFLKPQEDLVVDLGTNYLTRIRELRITDVDGQDRLYNHDKIEDTVTIYENLYDLNSNEIQRGMQKGFRMLLDKVIEATVYLSAEKFEEEGHAFDAIEEKLLDLE